ncbi:MAG: TetR-like C-terminal domain-containing protein [Cypionkella sp.]
MTAENRPAKPKGRPAAADATPKALKAAQKILLSDGFAKLSIERVAAMTGLGKPTLYRRWPNAGALAMQALLAKTPKIAAPSGTDLPNALTDHLTALIAAFASPWGRQVLQVLAAADPTADLTRSFATTLFQAPRIAAHQAFEAAIARGDIAEPPDLGVLLDMLYAPILSGLLLSQPLPDPALFVKTALLACTDTPRPKPTPRVIDPAADTRQFSLF